MQLGIETRETKSGVRRASLWVIRACLHGACAVHTSLLLGSLWSETRPFAVWDALSLQERCALMHEGDA